MDDFRPIQDSRRQYADALKRGDFDSAADMRTDLGISDEEFASHCHGRQHWHTWDVDWDFDDHAASGPGTFDRRVLDQDKVWFDILRRPHRIDDPAELSDEHLRNVIRFVEHHAWRWVPEEEVNIVAWTAMYIEASDGFEAAAREVVAEWIESTPLMRALRAEAQRRGIEFAPGYPNYGLVEL